MKTFLLKLCSLLVLAAGVLLIAYELQLTPVTTALFDAYTQTVDLVPIAPEMLRLVLGVVLGVVGVVALAPSPASRSKRRVVMIPTDRGEASVQLDAVAKVLTGILKRMPEVKKAKVVARPTKDRRRAIIDAYVTLKQEPDLAARHTVNLVTEHITNSAVQILGMEDLAEVRLHVDSMKVNAKQAAKAIAAKHPELEQKLAERGAVALAGASAVAAAPVEAIEEYEDEEPESPHEDGAIVDDAESEIGDNGNAAEEEDFEVASEADEEPSPLSASDTVDDMITPLPPLVDDKDSAAALGAFDTDNDLGLPPLGHSEAESEHSTENRSEPDTVSLFGKSAQSDEEVVDDASGAEDASWMVPDESPHVHELTALESEREAFWKGDDDTDPYHADAAEIGETAFSAVEEHQAEALHADGDDERALERLDLMAAADLEEDAAGDEDIAAENPIGLDAMHESEPAEIEAENEFVEPEFVEAAEKSETEPRPKLKRWGFF